MNRPRDTRFQAAIILCLAFWRAKWHDLRAIDLVSGWTWYALYHYTCNEAMRTQISLASSNEHVVVRIRVHKVWEGREFVYQRGTNLKSGGFYFLKLGFFHRDAPSNSKGNRDLLDEAIKASYKWDHQHHPSILWITSILRSNGGVVIGSNNLTKTWNKFVIFCAQSHLLTTKIIFGKWWSIIPRVWW